MKSKLYPHSYKLIITPIRDGDQKGFEIYVPALDAHVYGDTINEALEGYIGFFYDEVKYRRKKGIPMPQPDDQADKVKQVPLRIPTRVYQRISEQAKKQGQSFNSFVTHLLEEVKV